jgi:hypothetical protein
MCLSWLFREPTIEESKNKAYLIYSEFGPKLQIPRDKRLEDCFPKIPKAIRAAWLEEFSKVDREIGRIAEAGLLRTHNSAQIKEILRLKFSFMNNKSLSRAINLAHYVAWREGYPK